MALTRKQIEDYLKSTKKILLATVTDDNTPDIRILGAIATEGLILYFSTLENTKKVEQITNNPNVAVYFEAPGQKFPNYINVTVYGKAKKLKDEREIENAVLLIKENLPHFERTKEKVFYAVEPEKIKVYNSSAELNQEKVQVIEFK